MDMKSSIMLLGLLLAFSNTFSQNNRIVLEIDVPKNYERDSLEVYAFGVNEIYPYNTYRKMLAVIGNKARFDVSTGEPWAFYCNERFAGKFVYLLEPGDSIIIQNVDSTLFFSGRGIEKFNLLKESSFLTGSSIHSIQPIRFKPSIENYLGSVRIADSCIRIRSQLLRKYKPSLSIFAFNYLQAQLITEIEICRMSNYISLLSKSKQEPDIKVKRDLYNTTLRDSLYKVLTADASNPERNLTTYLFYYSWIKFLPDNNYLHKMDITKWYYYGKEYYKGLIGERYLSYVLTSWLMKRTGFTDNVENVLQDYYALSNFPEYKKWVASYEETQRKIVKGKDAPEFTLVDNNDHQLTLAQLKGKIVIIDFWFTGCKGCVTMSKAIKRLERRYGASPRIAILSVSLDRNKNKWLKSLQEKRFTAGTGLQAYTGGQGNSHPIVKNYNVSSAPMLHLVDQYGKIVDNPLPDPRNPKGEKQFVDLIEKQLNRSSDGPYIFYKKDSVEIAGIVAGKQGIKIDRVLASENEKTFKRFKVSVSRSGAEFMVNLKPVIKYEPSVFSTARKQFVLSDIEGNFEKFRDLLTINKIIDSSFKWRFGNGHLILCGDFFDRGDEVTECLWLVYSLEEQAKEYGGYVHFILGNHEIMNLMGNHKYTQPKYIETANSLKRELTDLYGPDSELGKWLRTKNIVEKIDDILYTHGGISQEVNESNYSVPQINELFRNNNCRVGTLHSNSIVSVLFSNVISPFWYRGYYENEDRFKASITQVDSTLIRFDVNKIITGHTIVSDTVTVHYNGKVINVDTHHAGGHSEALYIESGNYYRVNDKGLKKLLLYDKEDQISKMSLRNKGDH